MSYIVNFTDKENKSPITVYDNTSSVDTTLVFPGRKVSGYGQSIAENFLHLLENFASPDRPVNPVEGQMWYNSADEYLLVWDNVTWKAASGIRRGPQVPPVSESAIGELWVDTLHRQLKLFTGTRWILVGPDESTVDGLRTGLIVENVVDTNNFTQSVLVFYVSDVPVTIFSKNSFTPKTSIAGFGSIKAGININTPVTEEDKEEFEGGHVPKFTGNATSANGLVIADAVVSANKFMRTDTVNTTNFSINIKTDKGITIGNDGNIIISNSISSAKIYNSLRGSSLDLQVNRDGLPDTILRIKDNRVGINNVEPNAELDVHGEIYSSGRVTITDSSRSSNLSNGSFVTAGGAAIGRNLLLGSELTMLNGDINCGDIVPNITETFRLGTENNVWNTVHAKDIYATYVETDTLKVNNIIGTVNEAARLETVSNFSMAGDVTSNSFDFDGSSGYPSPNFNTTLSPAFINNKEEPTPNISLSKDMVIIHRTTNTGSDLYKMSRDNFIADLGVPIGAIIPFAGQEPPTGYLLCDGSEIEKARYFELSQVISTTYNGSYPLVGGDTVRLPDLRGRFALGRDNMDNGHSVPTTGGGWVDAGGGQANRIPGQEADQIGGNAGNDTTTLSLENIPDHTHDMKNSDGTQFSAVRVDAAVYPPATPGMGPTAANQAQYLRDSGKIKAPTPAFEFGQPITVVNPFLTINYIIRSGPPAF